MLHADLLLTGALVYESALRRFRPASVAIEGGRILYVGSDEGALSQIEPERVRDLSGRWLVPGLVDAHMHIESSMVTPPVFLRAALAHGTTTCVAEPHEIANVFGVEGIREFIRLSPADDLTRADVFFGAPSSVPSTDLEDAGAAVTSADVAELMADPRVRCLGEVMDCRSVIEEPEGRAAQVVRAAQGAREGAIIEGHVPAFMGLDLARILFSGVDSDHCEQTPERLRDRFEMGMFVEVQDKSCTPEVIGWLTERPQLAGLWSFVTDDVMADRLVDDHLARVVRHAISLGMPAAEAVYAATAAPAARMELHDRGRICPGRLADLVALDDLEGFHVCGVWRRGRELTEGVETGGARRDFPGRYYQSVHLVPLTAADFELAAPGAGTAAGAAAGAGAATAPATVRVRTMAIQEASTFTPEFVRELPVRGGRVCWKEPGDLALARVFERHHGTGNVGTALLSGCCLRRGAVASTWVHDHHNLLVVGCDERDMELAANEVIRMQGGLVVVEDGAVVASMPLPVAGILTEAPLPEAGVRLGEVTSALRRLGWGNASPVMSLCTIALPVSPALKVTDRGLVDVRAGRIVSLFVEGE